MDLRLDRRQRALREEAAAFCAGVRPVLEADPEWWRQGMLSDGDSREVNRLLGEAGWIGLSWPDELGGRGLTRLDATLVEEVLGYHWLPLSLVPALVQDDRCRDRALRARARGAAAAADRPGELVFCQGFSEPGAGSDLGALTTRAELRGDTWVVNGHKLWTSSAQLADWIYLAVRTDSDRPKHRGISVLVVPDGHARDRGADVRDARRRLALRDLPRRRRDPRARTSSASGTGAGSVLMYTLDFERITAEKVGGAAWVLDATRRGCARRSGSTRPHGAALAAPRRARGRRGCSRSGRPTCSTAGCRGARRRRWRSSPGARLVQGVADAAVDLLGLEGLGDAIPDAADRGPRGGALPCLGRVDDRRWRVRRAAARDRAAGARAAMSASRSRGCAWSRWPSTSPARSAGCSSRELGADVVKVEPPGGDAYRGTMPVAPGVGRFFVPLNRGKRSVVLDLKSDDGRGAAAARSSRPPTSCSTTRRPTRARGVRARLGRAARGAARRSCGRRDVVRPRGAARGARRRTTSSPRRAPACSRRTRRRVTRCRCAPAASRSPT